MNFVYNIYNYLVNNTKLKTTDDIIKYRSEYRPLTLNLIKSLFNKSGVSYTNQQVYDTLDKVSLQYVMSE